MKQTTIHKIPYPEDDDFTKGAVNLEIIAERVDSVLEPTWATYTSFNQFTMGAVSLTTVDPAHDRFDAGGLGEVFFDTIEFFDGGVAPGTLTNFQPRNAITEPQFNGWYTIGGYLPVTLTGTATTNSYREMQIIVQPLPGVPGNSATYHDRQYEDGTGANQLAVEATAYLFYGCQVQMFFEHGNTASGSFMMLGTGARLWAAQVTRDVG